MDDARVYLEPDLAAVAVVSHSVKQIALIKRTRPNLTMPLIEATALELDFRSHPGVTTRK
jgi:hypothetical protein